MAPLRLFGYGSLLYAPEIPDAVLERIPARLDGYRRAFNKLSRGRVCPRSESYDAFSDMPEIFVDGNRYRSLVLGTEAAADACIEGVILVYPATRREEVLKLTDRREGYRPDRSSWLNGYLRREVMVVRHDTGEVARCETWLTNTDPRQRYQAPELTLEERAKVLVNATPRRAWQHADGGLPYLEHTRATLLEASIIDPSLEALAQAIRALPGPWVERVTPPHDHLSETI